MSRPRDLYSRLYSVQRFTAKIADCCASGEAVVVMLPVWLRETDAWEIVKPAFENRNLSVQELQIEFAARPWRFLHAKIFGTAAPAEQEDALEALVETEWPLDKNILYVRNLSGRPQNGPGWYDAVHELSRRLAQKQSSTPRGFILFNRLDRHEPQPPQTDLPFRVLWWFGMPSVLDFRLLCRQVLDQSEDQDVVTVRWLETVIPVVAAGDYNQIEPIMEAVRTTNDNLHMHLDQFAQEKCWTASSLARDGADELLRRPSNFAWMQVADEPPPNIKLWADGALYATPEEGVRLHAAAVRLLAEPNARDDPEQRNFRLNHMIWQAQNALCYGLLNEARLILNESIVSTESPDWPFRVEAIRVERDELAKNALSCEIGHLRRLLDAGKLESCKPDLRESVARMNDFRRRLAHYQPLTLDELKEFAAVMLRLPEQLPALERQPTTAAGAAGQS